MDTELEAVIVEKFASISGELNERGRRIWAATESKVIGYGGDALVSRATGLARQTIRNGHCDIASGIEVKSKIRNKGGGRKKLNFTQPGIMQALESMVEPLTRGDPMSPLRWTCKSRARLASALVKKGWNISSTTVGRYLHELGYSLQSIQKSREGISDPDRNDQFENINATVEKYQKCGQPVISVDTKKKELVGNFKNDGQEWQPKGTPEKSLVHDFPIDSTGRAIPYGVYDMIRNEAWVSVGQDHDTPSFAVASIGQWWNKMGKRFYPDAKRLFITADAGGSNGYRMRAWKVELQKFANKTNLCIRVSHFPPGTSKWNKIEHRLFCYITRNWRGKMLNTFETIVDLIGNTKTILGLKVKAKLDKRKYPTGVKISKSQMDALSLVRDKFRGDWNYEIRPN